MKKKVLYISQEINPYVEENQISKLSKQLPQAIQELGKEVRIFMPCYGKINERRYQLHEVIRLSGMKFNIDGYFHPVNIKVTSVPSARMQVYFIDNDEYFERKGLYRDNKGKFYEDNDERVIFFARAVIEIVKKLSWKPDIIHCHGWFTSLVPFYIKNAYKNDANYSDVKIITSLYNDNFDENLGESLHEKMMMEGLDKSLLENYKEASYSSLIKSAIDHSDGLIQGEKEIPSETLGLMNNSKSKLLHYTDEENWAKAYDKFYSQFTSE